jgi:hypothetical protein
MHQIKKRLNLRKFNYLGFYLEYMAEVSSTNIADLPTNNIQQAPQQNDNSQNMSMNISEQTTEYKPLNENKAPSMPDMNSMNEIMNQTNNIASNGNLELPIRDVQIDNGIRQTDQETNNEYMVNENHPDYIDSWENNQEMIYNQEKIDNQRDSLEVIYSEFQLPILIMLLYFFFHLPVVNKWFHKNLTFCFMKDGNMNFQGYILKSIIFAGLFYFIHRNITFISKNIT